MIKIRFSAPVLSLEGSLTHETAMQAVNQSKSFLSQSPQAEVILDLQAIDHCDSASLACLLALVRESRTQGKILQLINMPSQMAQLANVSGLAAILPVVKT